MIYTGHGIFSSGNILDYYDILIPTGNWKTALEHIAVEAEPEYRGLSSKLASELKQQARIGYVVTQDLGRIDVTKSSPKTTKSPGYSEMKQYVITGLINERRQGNNPKYSGMNNIELTELTRNDVRNLTKNQVIGMYFDRFGPDRKQKQERQKENNIQPTLF